MSVNSIQRSTYDLLNLIGDLGGLHDGLYAICTLIIGSFQIFNYNFQMFSNFFSEYSAKYYQKRKNPVDDSIRVKSSALDLIDL